MTKYCPNCGEQLIDDANFCKRCGATINPGTPRADVPEPPAYEKSYTIHIVIAYALALIIPLLGIIMSVYLMTRNDSEKAKRHGKYALILSVVMQALSVLSAIFFY